MKKLITLFLLGLGLSQAQAQSRGFLEIGLVGGGGGSFGDTELAAWPATIVTPRANVGSTTIAGVKLASNGGRGTLLGGGFVALNLGRLMLMGEVGYMSLGYRGRTDDPFSFDIQGSYLQRDGQTAAVTGKANFNAMSIEMSSSGTMFSGNLGFYFLDNKKVTGNMTKPMYSASAFFVGPIFYIPNKTQLNTFYGFDGVVLDNNFANNADRMEALTDYTAPFAGLATERSQNLLDTMATPIQIQGTRNMLMGFQFGLHGSVNSMPFLRYGFRAGYLPSLFNDQGSKNSVIFFHFQLGIRLIRLGRTGKYAAEEREYFRKLRS